MTAEDEPAYLVTTEKDGYAVRNREDRALIGCADEATAAQFACLMNEAFRAGYAAARRETRAASA